MTCLVFSKCSITFFTFCTSGFSFLMCFFITRSFFSISEKCIICQMLFLQKFEKFKFVTVLLCVLYCFTYLLQFLKIPNKKSHFVLYYIYFIIFYYYCFENVLKFKFTFPTLNIHV